MSCIHGCPPLPLCGHYPAEEVVIDDTARLERLRKTDEERDRQTMRVRAEVAVDVAWERNR